MSLAESILAGNLRAAARLITLIDDGDPAAVPELKRLYPATGKAAILGITGPPGAGKSTLTDQLIGKFRQRGLGVAVVAVDPTSHLSGGAVLGDRVRMSRHAADPGVFIRSLGTRGHLGGISRSTHDIVNVFDAMGKEVVIIETVGVGQDEIEITRAAHTSLVVTVPGLGDEVQAIKAGVMEIADIFVVNKADRPGSEKTIGELQALVGLNHPGPGEWWPPVLATVASCNQGIDELVEKIFAHREHLAASGLGRRFEESRSRHQLAALLQDYYLSQVRELLHNDRTCNDLIAEIAGRRIDPYSALERLVALPAAGTP
jgi:GTPase